MPIYMRSSPGEKKGGDITGPYEEAKLNELRQYASPASVGKTIDIYWVCGRRRPMLCAIYQNGAQKYPRNKHEEKSLANVTSCMVQPGATTKSSERSPRQVTPQLLSKARKLPNRFTCPSKIVTSQPLQGLPMESSGFAMPSPVDDVGGRQVIEGGFYPPLAPLPGRTPTTPGYLYDPFQSLPNRR